MLGAGFIEFLFVVKIISKFIVSTKEIQNNLKPISVLDNLIKIFLESGYITLYLMETYSQHT